MQLAYKNSYSCDARQCWLISQYFGKCSVFNLTYIDFEEKFSYWSVQFVIFFSLLFIKFLSHSIGKPRMTPVSGVKTSDSYEVSSVTINGKPRKTPVHVTSFKTTESYKFVDESYGSPSGYYIYRNGPKRAGLITASNQIVRAVHSCDSWYPVIMESALNDLCSFQNLHQL